jgi:exonuclease SbcC
MIGWMFRKTGPQVTAGESGADTRSDVNSGLPAATADEAGWQLRLEAAAGDDAALLDIARQAPTIELKCAAVVALGDESALKLAEREFRTHDRRVHRTAKQRLENSVARRQATQRAAELIELAAGLLREPTIPTNRLVELDRAWQANNPAFLDPAQRSDFASLSARLTALTRERSERDALQSRWLAAARQTLPVLQRLCERVADGVDVRAALDPAMRDVQGLIQARPSDGTAAEVAQMTRALETALQNCAQIEPHLALLETLEQQPHAPAIERVAERDSDESDHLNGVGDPARVVATADARTRWQALAPPLDTGLRSALDRRYDKWQQAQDELRRAQLADRRQQSIERRAAHKQRQRTTLDELLQQAESMLADGNLAATQRHLAAADKAFEAGTASNAQHARLQALHAECARLKGWQRWGGGRARDELVAEAEQIAVATIAAMADPAQAARLPVKALADTIDALRQSWRELDRLGGAGNRGLWQRFDAALKSAYQPVAAQQALLKARRDENLQARLRLLDTLEAGAPPAEVESDAAAAPIDWKEPARALDQFQQAWRKLGPIEHTVPHKAREALTERLQRSVERIEAPLRQARQAARVEREVLISRAKALATEPQGRDLMARLRVLQSEWQQHAKALPLERPVEAALWEEFRAATNAFLAQRNAVHQARDAELNDNLARRETMLAGLEGLTQDMPAAQIKRVLADAEAQWHRPLDVPRAQVAALDTRYRVAHAAALRHLADQARNSWRDICDALSAKLALCHEMERGASAVEPDTRWAALPGLPPAWDSALAARRDRLKRDATNGPVAQLPSGSDLDRILLQLESALGQPSPPEFLQARRALKLQAMKAALERGSPAATGVAELEQLVGHALTTVPPSGLQRERFDRIVEMLRRTGPF